jgi:hypothetical protein
VRTLNPQTLFAKDDGLGMEVTKNKFKMKMKSVRPK